MKKVALENLELVFGNSLSMAEKLRLAHRSYMELSLGLADLAKAAARRGFADAMFEIEGREHLDRALSEGKGAIVCIAHFGPFAAMVYKFIEAGYPVSIIMRPPRGAYFRARFKDEGTRQKLNPIYSGPIRSCVLDSLHALKRGYVLFMPVDQNYGGPGRVFVDFFGRKAGTAPGPLIYATRTGSPILFAYALPLEKGRFKIVVEPPMPLAAGTTERDTNIRNMAVITARVESIARQYPQYWSWMHRRWKARPREGEI